MALTGNTTTIAFATSGFTANYRRIGGTKFSRPRLNDADLSTTNYETYIVGDLADMDEFEIEYYYDPDTQPPITGEAETVTITYPVPAGQSNGATLAGTGFCTGFEIGDAENNAILMATAMFTWDGKTEPTFTDAS